MRGLSLVMANGDYSLLCVGFSLWFLLWGIGSRHTGFSGCDTWLGSCVAQIWLLHGMGDPLELGIEPLSPVLADRLPTPGLPGKSLNLIVKNVISSFESSLFFLLLLML